VTLDLSKDFLRARKENAAVDLPRGAVRLTHPAFPGDVCGVLELEGQLLPEDEAVMRPVGAGREKPNEDPFLDGEDPHLKAHRDYIANLAITKGVASLGRNLFAGMKMMTYLYIAASVIGGLVFCATTIFMITK